MLTKGDLRQRQALPLNAKILMSQSRIREWYNHWNGDVFVSFSGGKDSTVLAHLVHEIYPDVPLVFANTGLEFPEIQSFARKMGAEFIYPKMKFSEVISRFGYPIISKENADAIHTARAIGNGKFINQKREELTGGRHCKRLSGKEKSYDRSKWLPLCLNTQFNIGKYCCNAMKKNPMGCYQRQHKAYPIIGTLAEESKVREQVYLKHGCNAFDANKKISQPISFWLEQDILRYIHDNSIEIASVYGDVVAVDDDGYEYEPMPGMDCKFKCTGCSRTGCVYCAFGLHLEKGETRFQRLAKTHPRQYEYCMGGGQWVDNPKYDPTAPKMDGNWVNWNPKKIWTPSKKGLGMKKIFDDCNEIYGKDFIRYE